MKQFIRESCKIAENELREASEKYNGTVYALYTDKLLCSEKLEDTKYLLEVRIFDENSEALFTRSSINEDFSFRLIDDDYFRESLAGEADDFLKNFDNRVTDDVQYLDIDEKKSIGKNYVSTGGGEYILPIENARKIHIRNYIDYDENGIAYFSDFRILKITGEE